MKTLLWPRFATAALIDHLGKLPAIELTVAKTFSDFESQLPGSRILVMPASLYSADVARLLDNSADTVGFLQLLTAGYDTLLQHGVPARLLVASAGDSWSPAVAEHAITLMLALTKQLPQALQAQRQRRWDSATLSSRMTTLRGRTLLIVGYGSIGREAAQRARGLGMRVIGLSRSRRRDDLVDEACGADDLMSVLPRADVVLLAMPSSPQTRGLFGAAQLAACKPGAVLINVARGNLVDPVALRAALVSGQLSGAGLDVTDPEPLAADDVLWDCPNLIITPHVSGASGAAGDERLAEHAAGNVARFVSGDTPSHLVSF